MNNLHRELAPIADAAWAQIETEATRTLKRHLGGRRVVDVRGPAGMAFSALSQLRLVGVNGPYSIVLSADAYTGVSETSHHGYPVLEPIRRLISGDIIWAPAIAGAFILTTRGGDFALQLGQDVSTGYLSHTDARVRLYLQQTFTCLLFPREAAVALTAPSA